METILNHVADLMLWGSVALIVWGGVLTLGHLCAADEPGGRAVPRERARSPKPGRFAGNVHTVALALLLGVSLAGAAQDDYERAQAAADAPQD